MDEIKRFDSSPKVSTASAVTSAGSAFTAKHLIRLSVAPVRLRQVASNSIPSSAVLALLTLDVVSEPAFCFIAFAHKSEPVAGRIHRPALSLAGYLLSLATERAPLRLNVIASNCSTVLSIPSPKRDLLVPCFSILCQRHIIETIRVSTEVITTDSVQSRADHVCAFQVLAWFATVFGSCWDFMSCWH